MKSITCDAVCDRHQLFWALPGTDVPSSRYEMISTLLDEHRNCRLRIAQTDEELRELQEKGYQRVLLGEESEHGEEVWPGDKRYYQILISAAYTAAGGYTPFSRRERPPAEVAAYQEWAAIEDKLRDQLTGSIRSKHPTLSDY